MLFVFLKFVREHLFEEVGSLALFRRVEGGVSLQEGSRKFLWGGGEDGPLLEERDGVSWPSVVDKGLSTGKAFIQPTNKRWHSI